MTRVGHVIYLHGFASSPDSSKAQRYRQELAAHGVGFSCPDLNLPAFETLTVTRMLEDVRRAVAGVPASPIALVGSSLGGFVAIHAAQDEPRVDRLILLAPAIDFGGNRLRQLGDRGIEEWRRLGRLSVFHYGDHQQREIGYALYADAARYDAHACALSVPVLAYQGSGDESVDPHSVAAWASSRPSVDLHVVDDGHQLTNSMDEIWRTSERFLGLSPARSP
jgi:pimeloyl-ACP methyl ester carboxylesterase